MPYTGVFEERRYVNMTFWDGALNDLSRISFSMCGDLPTNLAHNGVVDSRLWSIPESIASD